MILPSFIKYNAYTRVKTAASKSGMCEIIIQDSDSFVTFTQPLSAPNNPQAYYNPYQPTPATVTVYVQVQIGIINPTSFMSFSTAISTSICKLWLRDSSWAIFSTAILAYVPFQVDTTDSDAQFFRLRLAEVTAFDPQRNDGRAGVQPAIGFTRNPIQQLRHVHGLF